MSRQDPQAHRAGRRNPHRDGPGHRPADAPGARDGGDREPVRRPLRREPRRADRDRRGARRAARRRSACRRSASRRAQAQSYGKAAIVGEAGELEHAAAILHPKLGAPLRKAVEKGAALVPSAKKRGGLGTAIDVPLGHKDAAFVRSHFDAMEARVSRRAARQRDRRRGRRHRQRPAAAAHRRAAGQRDQGRRRAALSRRSPHHSSFVFEPKELSMNPLRLAFTRPPSPRWPLRSSPRTRRA